MSSQFRAELKDNMGLYVITTEAPGKSHLDVASAAIEGGAKIIQYRDKLSTNRRMYDIAKGLRKLTEDAGVKLIINDRVDLVLAVGADGVHLGEDDFSLKVTRGILGPEYIIGISATSIDEAVVAYRDGADYIGVGPVYHTNSKKCAVPPIGIEGIAEIKVMVMNLPMVAIGGISIDNVDEVMSVKPDGIAVISAVASAQNMAEAVRMLNEKIQRALVDD